jgi:hypothetical protein
MLGPAVHICLSIVISRSDMSGRTVSTLPTEELFSTTRPVTIVQRLTASDNIISYKFYSSPFFSRTTEWTNQRVFWLWLGYCPFKLCNWEKCSSFIEHVPKVYLEYSLINISSSGLSKQLIYVLPRLRNTSSVGWRIAQYAMLPLRLVKCV